jgi:hypothetical protein
MHDIDVTPLLGGAGIGGLGVYLARLYLQRAFKDIDKLVETMQQVQIQLSLIVQRLQAIEESTKLIPHHDREIAALKTIHHERDRRGSSFN